MEKLSINMENYFKYGCAFKNCNHRYIKTDGVRKHANKKHAHWIKAFFCTPKSTAWYFFGI